MNFHIELPFPIQCAMAVVVIFAAVEDLLTRHIPNWVTVPGTLAALGMHFFYSGVRGFALALIGAVLGFGVFLFFYALGGMGGGDVKLFATVGAFFGPQLLLMVFVLTGLLGGMVAVLLAAVRGRLNQTVANTAHLLVNLGRFRWQEVRTASDLDAPGALRLPYGAVIAGGALLTLWVGN